MTRARTPKGDAGMDEVSVSELYAKMSAQGAMLEDLYRAIKGNGTPGLLDKVDQVALSQAACPARAAYDNSRRTLMAEIFSNWVALAALGLSLYIMISDRHSKHDEHADDDKHKTSSSLVERAEHHVDTAGRS